MFLNLQNYRNGEQISGCQESGWRVKEGLQKGNMMRDLCGDKIVLYRDCINTNILVVILHCSFPRCYHWGKLGKWYTRPVLFLKTTIKKDF